MLGNRFEYKTGKSAIPMTRHAKKRKEEFESRAGELSPLACGICSENKFEEISNIDRYSFFFPTGICTTCGNIQQTVGLQQNGTVLVIERSGCRELFPEDVIR